MKLVHTEEEWRKYCHENGWTIIECFGCGVQDCPKVDKLCRVFSAVDENNVVQATFKCYVSYGKVFLNS